jgi:hypothetical protein
MKISNFNTASACEKGAWVIIKDFDDLDTDMRVKVLGVDSKAYKSQINRLVKMNEQNKNKVDMEKLEASSIRTLVAITIDWENIEDDEENTIPFTKEMAQTIYENSPHISNQIIGFAKERVNFLD